MTRRDERRKGRCDTCGETREMATKTECYMCYRRRQREADDAIDRHNPAIRREHRQLLTGWSKLMVALSELRVNRRDALAIRDLVAPYVRPVAEFLPGEREQSGVHVHVPGDEDDDGVGDDDGAHCM